MAERDGGEFAKIVTVEGLERLVAFLRGPDGCPWDRRQTSKSLKPYFLEEFHELLEAIEEGQPGKLREELGDVLLHLCFQVSLAREAGDFGLEDVVAGIRDKMIRRHPHVFGEEEFGSREEQLFVWEKIKLQEKSRQKGGDRESVLDGLPRGLPALLRSYRIQGRVSKYSFDWDEPGELFAKLEEEIGELREALDRKQTDEIEEEIGDLLFTVVNLSRLLHVHPHEALERTNDKFVRRFKRMEHILADRGQKLGDLPLAELDEVWDEVKAEERAGE